MNKYRYAIKAVFMKGIVEIEYYIGDDEDTGKEYYELLFDDEEGETHSFSGQAFNTEKSIQSWIHKYTLCLNTEDKYILSCDYTTVGILSS